ncbi:MAG TPA: PA2169 family four-helix-bundle protein [Candidatus Binataceae bacterium]|jgi:uncharacterized protein (TIGR02284 family)
MKTTENTIEILDRLIGVAVDTEKFYRRAAKDVGRADLEEFFHQRAARWKNAADELQAQRKRLGVADQKEGTWGGVMDRTAMDISVAMSKGDSGVVEWAREDAEAAAAEYEKALAANLSPELRTVVQRQLADVRAAVASLEQVLRVYGGPRS